MKLYRELSCSIIGNNFKGVVIHCIIQLIYKTEKHLINLAWISLLLQPEQPPIYLPLTQNLSSIPIFKHPETLKKILLLTSLTTS